MSLQFGTREYIFMRHAIALLQGCVRQGVDPKSIFSAIDMDPELLEDPDGTFPLRKIGDLVRTITHTLQDETLGFLNRKTPLGSVEMGIHAIVGSETLADAIQRWIKYWSIVNSEIQLDLKVSGEEAHHIGILSHDGHQKSTEAAILITWTSFLFVRLSSWLIDKPILIERMCFSYPESASSINCVDVFPTSFHYDQPQNTLVFNKKYLDMPVVQTFRETPNFLKVLPDLMTVQHIDESYSGRINRLFRTSENIDSLTFETVSRSLNIAPNILRRRLKKEGMTFIEIKESARRDLALYYLQGSSLKINEVAYRLGFSEPSAFNRAFKKWTGCTPGDFRNSSSLTVT